MGFSQPVTKVQERSLEGIVVDQVSGTFIKGATVVLFRKDNSSVYQTAISDSAGIFLFLDTDSNIYRLSVSCDGYEAYDTFGIWISRLHHQLLQISLKRKYNQLDQVIIRSREQPYIQQQTDRITVNINALTANNGSSVMDVLGSTPGIVVDETGSISYRGKECVAIYIDDRPSYLTPADLVTYLRSLPAGQVEKIEIISNPPARYNAEGSAGIINIKMRKLNKKGWNGNLSSAYSQGRLAKFNESVNLSYVRNKLSVYGTGIFAAPDNYYDVNRSRAYSYPDAAKDYILWQHNEERNKRKTYSAKLGLDYDWSRQTTMGILLQAFSSPYDEHGLYRSIFTKPSGHTDSILNSNSILKTSAVNRQINLYLRHVFKKTGRVLTSNVDYLAHRDQQHQLLESAVEPDTGNIRSNLPFLTDNSFSASIYSIRADYTQQLFNSLTLETGAQSSYTQRRNRSNYHERSGADLYTLSDLNNSFQYRERIDALYVNLKKEQNRFSVQAGLRAERTGASAKIYDMPFKPDSSFRLNYMNVFPTLYLSYKTDSAAKHQFNISAGKRITRPNYQDLNPSTFFFDRNTSVTGNPLLHPELSYNVEGSYTFHSVWTSGITWIHTKGMIVQAYEQAGQAYMASNRNIDDVISAGVFSNLFVSILKSWLMNLSMEWTNNRYKGVLFGTRVFNKGGTIRMTAYQQFTLGKGWSADLTAQYRGRVVYAQAVLKPTWQMHASIQKKLSAHAVIAVAGRDIFRSWLFQRTVTIPEVVAFSRNRSDTRYLTITCSYKFGSKENVRSRKTGIEYEQSRIGG